MTTDIFSAAHALRSAIVCAHHDLTVLGPTRGYAGDDHETAHVQCQLCHRMFVATFWRTDRDTDLAPMPLVLAAYYAAKLARRGS